MSGCKNVFGEKLRKLRGEHFRLITEYWSFLSRKFSQDADLNTLVKHALTALKESSQNGEINSKNTSISIVGAVLDFEIAEGSGC